MNTKAVIKRELSRFRKALQVRQSELAKVLRKREGIVIERSPDALDEVQHAAERELAVRNLDRESRLLLSITGALRRMAEGSYGTCMRCEEQISLKRLEAVPWAGYCIRCQEVADRHQNDGDETLDDLLVSAA
jgi:DnaK suppressor protein